MRREPKKTKTKLCWRLWVRISHASNNDVENHHHRRLSHSVLVWLNASKWSAPAIAYFSAFLVLETLKFITFTYPYILFIYTATRTHRAFEYKSRQHGFRQFSMIRLFDKFYAIERDRNPHMYLTQCLCRCSYERHAHCFPQIWTKKTRVRPEMLHFLKSQNIPFLAHSLAASTHILHRQRQIHTIKHITYYIYTHKYAEGFCYVKQVHPLIHTNNLTHRHRLFC